MFCRRLNPIFAFVGVATFLIGLSAIFVWNNRHYQRSEPQPHFEELEINGFDEVTSAKDGDLVTVSGWIDNKVLCNSILPRRFDVCEAGLIGDLNEKKFLPVRIPYCSENLRSNCMSPPKEPFDFRDVYVLDAEGRVVDFDGERLVEPPNTWISNPQRLSLTGRVTRVNGVGRFIDPVVQIQGLKY